MRLVTFAEMLELPVGTIFRSYEHDRFFGINRKEGNFVDEEDGTIQINAYDVADEREMFGRQKSYWNDGDRFLVYEPHDMRWLAGMLGLGEKIPPPEEVRLP